MNMWMHTLAFLAAEVRWLDAEGNGRGGAWRLLSARARAALAGHVYLFPSKAGEGEEGEGGKEEDEDPRW
jgi:hypothetical protein